MTTKFFFVNDNSRAFHFDTVPDFTGQGQVAAVHELHIFMFVNPTSEQILQYKLRVDYWNEKVLPVLQERDSEKVVHTRMKAPVLTLWFRDGNGTKPVTVCQSARHVQCNDRVKVVELCEEDKQFFENDGQFATKEAEKITVVRQKIEACAYNIVGVPQTDKQAACFPMRYFEVHIRTQKKEVDTRDDLQPISDQEHEQLKEIANRLSLQFGIAIPLSINVAKGYQRFLNVRFYGMGMEKIEPILCFIRNEIEKSGDFVAPAHMSTPEYVWFDSLKSMDSGWIDYTPEEFTQLQKRLKKENFPMQNATTGKNDLLVWAAVITTISAIFAYWFLIY